MHHVTLVVGAVLMASVLYPAYGEEPLTVVASNVGDFAKGGSWYLSVNSAGKAELTIESKNGQIRREFEVPKEQLDDLRSGLSDNKFFDLADQYGQRVPSGSTQSLAVTLGDRTKCVQIHYLMNWVSARDKDKLREPARAVELLVLIRGWFAEAGAVDLRDYDRKVLEVVK